MIYTVPFLASVGLFLILSSHLNLFGTKTGTNLVQKQKPREKSFTNTHLLLMESLQWIMVHSEHKTEYRQLNET